MTRKSKTEIRMAVERLDGRIVYYKKSNADAGKRAKSFADLDAYSKPGGRGYEYNRRAWIEERTISPWQEVDQ